MDTVTPQINQVLGRWGNAMPVPVPGEKQLAAEYDHAMTLLATDPPDYQRDR